MSFNASNMSLIHGGASWLELARHSCILPRVTAVRAGTVRHIAGPACSLTKYSFVEGAPAQ